MTDISQKALTEQYYQTPSSSMQVSLRRNMTLGNTQFSRLSLFMIMPSSGAPQDKMPLPDFTYALQIQSVFNESYTQKKSQGSSMSSSSPSSSLTQDLQDNKKKNKLDIHTYLLTFGDLSRGPSFIMPQERDKKGRLAITNLAQNPDGTWEVPPQIQKRFQIPYFNSPSHFLFHVQNILGGCALFCEGATAILPNASPTNPDLLSYSLILWLFDSQSPAPFRTDLSQRTLIFTVGYINRQGRFRPFSPLFYPRLIAPISVAETRIEYQSRIAKEKSQFVKSDSSSDKARPLDEFFQSLTKGLDTEDTNASSSGSNISNSSS